MFITFDQIVNLTFLADIIIRFRTTYIHPITGEEVIDSDLIAKRYLEGPNFIIDTLSTIPLNDFLAGEKDILVLQLLGILKLLRVLKINGVIMSLNMSPEIKALLKVLYLVFFMCAYIHLFGCLWYAIVTAEEKWIPNMDFIWFGTPQIYDFYYADLERSYFTSMYIEFYLFGVGEVCPRTQLEILTSIPVLILSSIMNGLIIGNMALYLQELNKKNADFQTNMDTVNTAMNALNLDEGLRRAITEFFITTNSTSTLQGELDDFMRKRISQTYRILCSMQIFRETILDNYITKRVLRPIGNTENESYNEDVIINIVKRMETLLKVPESPLCVQEDEITPENDAMFFIAKGKCSVFVNDKFANERQESKLVRVLDPGSHFGEISLLYQTKRSATVIAKYYLTCAKLDRANYNELLQIYPNLNELIKSHFLLYDDPLRIWMEISMNQIEFF